MSEQKTNFMYELDLWLDANVIGPLESAAGTADFGRVAIDVKKGIRTKVLESYHNGQAAGPKVYKQPQKGGR